MTPVEKALWFIESHFNAEIALDDIAAVGGVTRYHMSRAFGLATGRSVMRYVRGRRLTQAARLLSNGAPNILELALEAGYGSHEAFTRAFKDEFGVTPEAVRAARCLDNLALVEPIRMNETQIERLTVNRYQRIDPKWIAGLCERCTEETSALIPALWQRFQPHLGHVPGQIGRDAYGVIAKGDHEGQIDYIAGVEVSDVSDLPAEYSRVRIPSLRYAVFEHQGHVSAIRRTWMTIWNRWLPDSGHRLADAPEFERYTEAFDPWSGAGGIEIWIPLAE